MILISHEVPVALFEESKKFNDYDYCLLHLTYENEEYRQFYKESIKNGRKVLLDNSLFELGDALTNDQLAEGVLDIRPTWFVVPDCLNNADVTMSRFVSFLNIYKDLPGLKIGVAQGDTVEELRRCYRYMSKYADKIAIPFDSKAFDELTPEIDDILEKWAVGRQRFIRDLVVDNLWCDEKPHHLLGCSYAWEFNNPLYRQISVESIDTSNPVVCGIKGVKYDKYMGNLEKPSVKLCDLIDYKHDSDSLKLIKSNVKAFRSLVNG